MKPFVRKKRIRVPSVCIVAYSSYSSDRRVRRYAETLAEEGYSIDVLCLRRKLKYRSKSNLEAITFIELGSRSHDERGPLSYFISLFQFFVKGSIILCWRYFVRRYQVIHINSVPDFLVFMAALPRLAGCKVILDIHDILPEFYCQKFQQPASSLGARFLRAVELFSVQFASHVIVANDLWRIKVIRRDRIDAKKCTTLLNYADFRYSRLSARKVDNSGFTLIYPGTFSYLHGIDVAIRAMWFVHKELPHVRLRMYGWARDTRFGKEMKELVRTLGLGEVVELHESVPLEELRKILEEVDIGLVPKRNGIFSSEAFSTKILDYMAAGLPVIASRTKVDEFYFNDSQIKFFSPGNNEELAQCIIELYNDCKQREALVRNAQQYVKSNNWNKKKALYLKLIG